MSDQKKPVRYDLRGADNITNVLMELINQFPGLSDGESIKFSVLEENSGKAMFPISGAVIQTETESITGHVSQTCLYPFMVVFRASAATETRKIKIKQWLDNLGKWIERQPVDIDGNEYKLSEYPQLAEDQRLISISRQTPGFLEAVNDNQSEDWQIQIFANYMNEFDR